MEGKVLKKKLEELGFSKVYIAKKMGTQSQNINGLFLAGDVKTGTLEKLSEVLEVPISVFYGEAYNRVSNVSGNNNATATGNNNTVSNSVSSTDDRLLALLLNKDEQLNKAMDQTTKALQQTDIALAQSSKSQEQLDEVIAILSKA